MAASEIRRAIMGRIPECLRNCVNKEYFMGPGSYPEGTGNINKTNTTTNKSNALTRLLTHLHVLPYNINDNSDFKHFRFN